MRTHAGLATPKNIVIPHLLSMRSRSGTITVPEQEAVSDNSAYRSNALYSRIRHSVPRRMGVAELNIEVASFFKASNVKFVRRWFQRNFFEKYVIHREPANASGS